MSHLRIVAFFLMLGSALAQDTWNAWLNEGVRAFKSAHYREAVAAFQKSVDLNPSAIEPRLYLASAWMNQYIPGATSLWNLHVANNAERALLTVLDLDPKSVSALGSLASLKYLKAQGAQTEADKSGLLDEARDWYLKVVEADPGKKEAHYSLGVIAWDTWYRSWNAARVKSGLRPDEPGPLPAPAMRADLRSRYEATLQDGIGHLDKALAIDPNYDDAMAYMNLILREYADLADSKSGYEKMKAEADAWVQKALDARREKSEVSGLVGPIELCKMKAMEPPPEPAAEQASPPRRIRVGGGVMQSRLIYRVAPTYPPDAKKAHIRGTVRLQAIVAKDGSVLQLDVESGQPLLAPAALEVVRQWKYRPTLLNGEPVEVVTTIDVNFVLDGESK